MTASCFAIVPDGQVQPSAFFDDLGDAMEWALQKYGGDRFSIRRFVYLEAVNEGGTEPAAEEAHQN